MLGPHTGSRGIPDDRRCFSGETLIQGPRWSSPLAFSVRVLNNVIYYWSSIVYAIPTWKTKVGTMVPPVSLRFTHRGSFLLQVQHFSMCYRMHHRRSHPEARYFI